MHALALSPWDRYLVLLRDLLRGNALDICTKRVEYSVEDLELFYDLCMVLTDGNPAVQQYLASGSVSDAPAAAREARITLESSVLIVSDATPDHIELLKKFESLGPQPHGRVRRVARFLGRALARVLRSLSKLRRQRTSAPSD